MAYPYDNPEYYAPERPHGATPRKSEREYIEEEKARPRRRQERGARKRAARALTPDEPYSEEDIAAAQDDYALKTETEAPSRKLAGVVFWLMFALALAKDATDVLLNLSLFLSILTMATGALIGFILFLYLALNGVFRLEKRIAKKLAITVAAIIIELIPFLNFIPTVSATLLVLRWMENHEYAQKLTRALAIKHALTDKKGAVRKRIRNRKARKLRRQRRIQAQNAPAN